MRDPLNRFRIKKWIFVGWIVIGVMIFKAADPASSKATVSTSSTAPSFIEFESGQVRPLAMAPDKTKLFAVNTPNNTLEIFDITPKGLSLRSRVQVGLEPVAVAVRNNHEIWVVNFLSDSVSVVDLNPTPRVVRTLLVGDEPRDIVFAGAPSRAFITTAHRGQQRTDPSIANVPGAGDPQLTTPGVGRADVWIFDPNHMDGAFGGKPEKIMTFFTDTPRALAVSPDSGTVYVAGFKTGNQTTTVPVGIVCGGFDPNTPCTNDDGTESPGGNPGPATNVEGKPAPESGLIVKFNNETQQWEDELGRNWNNSLEFSLPDKDVFAINANTLTQSASFAHVGTTLFNMVTNPVTGRLYVSNTESFNQVRFEGPGIFGGSTVQGHLAETRITVISDSKVQPRRINKHIDYSKLAGDPGFDPTAKDHSLSTPLEMEVTRDGRTLYMAAFGSSKIGVFDTEAIEKDTFNPVYDSANYIPVSGGGPSGLVLDEERRCLYVLTRFDNALKVIDLDSKREIGHLPMPDPEPQSVIQGRPFLYDATRFSGNGESSCASCHIFGDMDDLAWDLGNPDNPVTKNPITINFGDILNFALSLGVQITPTPINGTGLVDDFHSMKGPMTTQTLRGLRNSGAMHWRGDRSNGVFGIDPTDSNLSFKNFDVAFSDLLGSPDLPSEDQMQMFSDFQLQVLPPPNPVRSLDNSLNDSQQRGHDFFTGTRPADGIIIPGLIQETFSCNGCHVLDSSQGFFGTGRNASFENEVQILKIPHLRNLYAKAGKFGFPKQNFFLAENTGFLGDQIRGFGFLHDGSVDTVFHFLTATVFQPTANIGFPDDDPDSTRRDVEQFVLAFDSDLAPIVGQQMTLSRANATMAGPRIDLMIQRAKTPFVSKELGGQVTECDLIANLTLGGQVRKFLFDPTSGNFISEDGKLSLPDASLREIATHPLQEVTYTCLPPGSGSRILLNP